MEVAIAKAAAPLLMANVHREALRRFQITITLAAAPTRTMMVRAERALVEEQPDVKNTTTRVGATLHRQITVTREPIHLAITVLTAMTGRRTALTIQVVAAMEVTTIAATRVEAADIQEADLRHLHRHQVATAEPEVADNPS
jgi:hypothetical protein